MLSWGQMVGNTDRSREASREVPALTHAPLVALEVGVVHCDLYMNTLVLIFSPNTSPSSFHSGVSFLKGASSWRQGRNLLWYQLEPSFRMSSVVCWLQPWWFPLRVLAVGGWTSELSPSSEIRNFLVLPGMTLYPYSASLPNHASPLLLHQERGVSRCQEQQRVLREVGTWSSFGVCQWQPYNVVY